jgi:DNA segregation ATPase FtsK/SpoIIIE, S-DNA-T family
VASSATAPSAGIRATELRPRKDVKTSIVTGASPERFEIVKWFYIEADDDTGYDAATDVITRAMAYLDSVTPIAGIAAAPAQQARDLLADLATVLGDQRVPDGGCATPAAGRRPGLPPDQGLTGVELRELLEREHGIKVASTGNRYPVDPTKIHARIAWRAADGPDEGRASPPWPSSKRRSGSIAVLGATPASTSLV